MKEQRPKRSLEFVRGVIWENERLTAMHLLGAVHLPFKGKQAIARQCADSLLRYWDAACVSGAPKKVRATLKRELRELKKSIMLLAKQHKKPAQK